MNMPYPPQTPAGVPVCYRHPDRQTYVGCSRCGRPACPDCLRGASVGHQCVDCVAAAAQSAPAARTAFGGVPRTGPPVVTYVLIGISVAFFLLQATSATLLGRLALWPPAVADGDFYRLVTSAFLHYGVLHLLFNMWALYIVGPPLEEWLGRLRYVALYALSALGGSVMVCLFSPLNASTVGASGAVFGLFGATFVVARRLRLDVRWVVALIVINLVLTFSIPGISWQGHLGGLLTGGAIAGAYVYAPRAHRTMVQAGATAAVVVLFFSLIVWRTADLTARFGAMVGPH